MAFTCDYGQRKRKHEIQNLKREVELEEEYATKKSQEKRLNRRR